MEKMSPASKEHDEKPARAEQRQSRTQRACDSCRKRKVRCTGEPRCQNCVDQGVSCVYTQARRDRLNEATQQNGRLVALLKDLSMHVSNDGQRMIDEHLDTLGNDTYMSTSAINMPIDTPSASGKRSREASPSYEGSREKGPRDATVSESVGNDGPLDEDLLQSRETRATGFVGANSSMQWMRSLKTQMGSPNTTRNADGSIKPADILRVSDSTFYLDRNDLRLDDVVVDPYELPGPEVAERLFDCYMRTVHASFPILPYAFEQQFRKYNDSVKRGRPHQVPDEWQAMLNLVMAIGAQYSHLIQVDWREGVRDHLIYKTRATRILRLDKLATSLPSPNLSFIQSTGLLALYYLTIGQVSRAWMMIGISLRFALAAGIHLRNEDPSAPATKTETLVHTWWSLHSIETLLCAIIGRPCIIPNDECSVPLPQDLPQLDHLSPSSNSTNSFRRGDTYAVTSSSFLGARVTIALIMQKTLSKLYSPRISADSWDSIQRDITSLMTELDSWAGAAHLAGLSATSALEEGVDRHNLLLAFHYQSTKLLICRPCLCRLERRKEQSDALAQFNTTTAEACVAAAQAITWLLPDEPDRKFFYEQTPWWSTVHIIMQAVAVLLLKMSFGPSHMTHKGEQLPGTVRKLVRWLRRLSATSDVAERAYNVTVDIIRISAPRIQIDITTPVKEEPAADSRHPSLAALSPFFPTPSSTTYSEPSISFSQSEWDKIHSARPASTNTNSSTPFSPESNSSQISSPNAGMQYTNPNIGPQPRNPYRSPHQTADFTNYQFDPTFMLDSDISTPSLFGNPFLTNFDPPGPLFNTFYSTTDMNMNGAFSSFGDHNEET